MIEKYTSWRYDKKKMMKERISQIEQRRLTKDGRYPMVKGKNDE